MILQDFNSRFDEIIERKIKRISQMTMKELRADDMLKYNRNIYDEALGYSVQREMVRF